MTEINFCPFCDAPQHKLAGIKEGMYFCKECNRFFKSSQVNFKCLKCSSTDIIDSEFPSPDGQLVFQCNKCKNMASAKEFLEKNNI